LGWKRSGIRGVSAHSATPRSLTPSGYRGHGAGRRAGRRTMRFPFCGAGNSPGIRVTPTHGACCRQQTREAVDSYIGAAVKKLGHFLFGGRRGRDRPIATRQYARLVCQWIASVGLDRASLAHTHCPEPRRHSSTAARRAMNGIRSPQSHAIRPFWSARCREFGRLIAPSSGEDGRNTR